MIRFIPVATIFACALSAFIIYFTPSEEVVVSKSGVIYGTVEQIREKLQGREFWANQARLVERAIADVDNEVEEAKKTEERVLRFQEELDEKLLKSMESLGASGLAVQAHLLRSRAEALETMDMYESRRQRLIGQKLPNLKSAQDVIQKKLQAY